MNNPTLLRRDQKVIWHPFTQHGIETEFLPVMSAQGSRLLLENGETIIDAISSWWVNLHGHGHPAIISAIHEQANKLEHVIFAGFTHEPAISLAEKLISDVQNKGARLTRCFYSDNGSTAVEVAMKMAYQFHRNQGDFSRIKFLALENSYHGDTLGCMSVSARGSYHNQFEKLLSPVDFIAPEDLTALHKFLEINKNQYAALIIEPMVQAAGGMQMHSAEFLTQLVDCCRRENILVICDEVFTGFFRTGKCFAFEHAQIKPDLLCLAKGLTGGFLPLAITLATEEIFANFVDQSIEKAFLHGHSFTANPLACAAGLASWHLLQQKDTQDNIARISQHTTRWLQEFTQHVNTANCRQLGTIGAIEPVNKHRLSSSKVKSFAIQNGVLIRPLKGVLSSVPPYCTTNTELDQIYTTFKSILDNPGKFT